ncbi:hypothetical protein DN752_03300 [Echinicola strongylocentroti]|uniref:Outer membrane protein beta-barrel domain-containing protein n=2 Tax=Echinicola strongylocentroti TaxID=1795355 RepID=A0A2Z4IEB1_9BACT|nr:hypothetical protein DN752_03300 [Echinicola strongylocentroti]
MAVAAQEKPKKGFISVGIGPSISLSSSQSYISNGQNTPPPQYFTPGTLGANVTLLEAGYVFPSKIGITLKWSGTAFIKTKETELSNGNIETLNAEKGVGSIAIGPMYSFALTPSLNLDIKARIGRMYLSKETSKSYSDGSNSSSSSKGIGLGGEFGVGIRKHFARKWSWMTGIDLQGARNGIQLNTSFGIGFRY